MDVPPEAPIPLPPACQAATTAAGGPAGAAIPEGARAVEIQAAGTQEGVPPEARTLRAAMNLLDGIIDNPPTAGL